MAMRHSSGQRLPLLCFGDTGDSHQCQLMRAWPPGNSLGSSKATPTKF